MLTFRSILFETLLLLLICVLSGCKSKIEDEDPNVRRAAISEISDQALLIRLAIEDLDLIVRKTAAARLTDQVLLAKLVVESKDWEVREIATKKLLDQALLMRLAIEDIDVSVRLAAIEKLIDPTILASIALADNNSGIREAAFQKLALQTELDANRSMIMGANYDSTHSMLAKLGKGVSNLIQCAQSVANLSESDSILLQIAHYTNYVNRDARICIARVKLASQEPRIKLRLPSLRCIADASLESRSYSDFLGHIRGRKEGESITISLHQGGEILAQGNWKPDFSNNMLISQDSHYSEVDLEEVKVEVCCEDILKKLLHLKVFAQEDLVELLHSKIPEIRVAAVSNLTNQVLLTKLADEDVEPFVRIAAIERLIDQEILLRLTRDKTRLVSEAAEKRLTSLHVKLPGSPVWKNGVFTPGAVAP